MATSSGRPIDPVFVKSIEKGRTTMEEVRATLGKPMTITQSADTEEWTYMHWEGKPVMIGNGYSKSKSQVLRVQFKGRKVADFSLTTTDQ